MQFILHQFLLVTSVAAWSIYYSGSKGFPVGPYCAVQDLEAGFLGFRRHRADSNDFLGVRERFFSGMYTPYRSLVALAGAVPILSSTFCLDFFL